MLSDTVIPYLKRHLYIGRISFAFPFEWDETSRTVVLIKSKKRELINKILLLLNLAYVIFMTINLIYGTMSLPKRLQGGCFLVLHQALLCVRWNWDLDKGMIGLLNSLLHFEKTFLKGNS